jgi:hypothetical protein
VEGSSQVETIKTQFKDVFKKWESLLDLLKYSYPNPTQVEANIDAFIKSVSIQQIILKC